MEVEYRQLFLKDLKKLKKQPIYDQIVDIAFERLPLAINLEVLSNIKAMKGGLLDTSDAADDLTRGGLGDRSTSKHKRKRSRVME